jgi:NAD(P)-dependent dehydrogenase (short-subunit alcohol dehydrogenase family)
MDLGIAGKRALVTASGRGLGRGIAETLAREGAKVAVVSRTSQDIEDLLSEIGGTSEGHIGFATDLESDGGPKSLLNYVRTNDFWPIDIVVHNLGGTLNVADPFCEIEDWRRVWRINMEVALELNQELLPSMRQRGWGRVVHISSIAAVENHGPVPYCSVKAALSAYSRSMGRVLAPEGVIMTSVLPGAVFTEGGYWDMVSRERPEHVEKYLADRMAINRFGKVDEVSGVVAFLCSDHASFCVGSMVPVDGGQGRGFFGT